MNAELWRSWPEHPKAILDETEVLRIKLVCMLGWRTCDIARELGLKYHTVDKVVKRVNWKHIEPAGSGWYNGVLTGDLSEKGTQLEAGIGCRLRV